MDKNYNKLRQIVQVFKNNKFFQEFNYNYIKKIIDSGYDVNYKLPPESSICQAKPEYSGNTALHLAAELDCDSACFDVFIECGADLTIKNDNGYTPLLLAFNKNHKLDSLLKAHVKLNNATNVKCQNGMSHFHVACSTDLVDVVNLFYKAGVPINERVIYNSPKYSGYTPLHFAVQYRRFETIKFLLSYEASLYIKDAHGMSSLHLAMKIIMREGSGDIDLIESYQKAIRSNFLNLPDDEFLSSLQIACVLGMNELVDQLIKDGIDINTSVDINSPMWPGYTALHFASHINLKSVIMLLDREADILAKDASGTTPFDICEKKFDAKGMIQILSTEKVYCLSKLEFIDGMSLLDVLHAMMDVCKFQQFIKNRVYDRNTLVPLSSPIWPGYNLLHLTTIFKFDYLFAYHLLFDNADFKILNADNMSPLHLAFRRQNVLAVEAILNTFEYPSSDYVDRDNLSHLHIACAMEHGFVVSKLLSQVHSNPNLPTLSDFHWKFHENDSNIILKSNSTPLHVAIRALNYDLSIIDLLLSYGANPNLADADGVTPFQAFLDFENNSFTKSKVRYMLLLDRMLNIIMDYEIENDEFIKIIHMALDKIDFKPTTTKKLVRILDQHQLYEKVGLTRLQVACALDDLSVVKEELESGAAVNQRIACDSPIWPGNTALHIVVLKSRFIKEIAECLLNYGADPTIKNANNSTPIHLGKCKARENLKIIITWLDRKNFTRTNPMDNVGLSHFHLCCMSGNLSLTRKFLNPRFITNVPITYEVDIDTPVNNDVYIIKSSVKCGVDIDSPVNHFGSFYDGYTPLHFAIEFKSMEIVKLLLQCGADITIETTNGFTPLHLAATNHNLDLQSTFLEYCEFEVDLKAVNAFGETIPEKVLADRNSNIDSVYGLIDKGAPLNISKISSRRLNKLKFIGRATFKLAEETFCQLIKNLPDLSYDDDKGKNILYYAISNNDSLAYLPNIKELIRKGYEINRKDNEGKTALHKVIRTKSSSLLKLFLSLGADINIKDDKGNTAFFYASLVNLGSQNIFIKHITYLRWLGLYIDSQNTNIISNFSHLTFPIYADNEKHELDLKLKEINSSLSVDYFFSEQFVIKYKGMPVAQRKKIYLLCNAFNLSDSYSSLHSFIVLQYKKAHARTRLLEPAAIAFQELTFRALPYLCIECIFKHVNNNDDLMNLIRAENGKLEYDPIFDN